MAKDSIKKNIWRVITNMKKQHKRKEWNRWSKFTMMFGRERMFLKSILRKETLYCAKLCAFLFPSLVASFEAWNPILILSIEYFSWDIKSSTHLVSWVHLAWLTTHYDFSVWYVIQQIFKLQSNDDAFTGQHLYC